MYVKRVQEGGTRDSRSHQVLCGEQPNENTKRHSGFHRDNTTSRVVRYHAIQGGYLHAHTHRPQLVQAHVPSTSHHVARACAHHCHRPCSDAHVTRAKRCPNTTTRVTIVTRADGATKAAARDNRCAFQCLLDGLSHIFHGCTAGHIIKLFHAGARRIGVRAPSAGESMEF